MGVIPSENDVLDRDPVQNSLKNFIVNYDYLFFFLFAFCITWGLAASSLAFFVLFLSKVKKYLS